MSDAPEAPSSQLLNDAEHEPPPDALAIHSLVRLHTLMILIVFVSGLHLR